MTHITIAGSNRRADYTVSASPQTAFTVPYPFFATSDLVVLVGGVEKTETTDYVVTGSAVDGGYESGTVTLNASVTNTEVSVVGGTPIERTTDFPYPSPTLNIKALNTELDRLTAIAQELSELNARSIHLPTTDPDGLTTALPAAADRSNLLLGFDASGNVVVINPLGVRSRGTWATTTAYVLGDIVSDGAAGANTKNLYYCAIANTSGVWATDLAANKWSLFVPAGATGPTGATGATGAGAPWSVAGGSANAVTASYTPAITTLTDGLELDVRFLLRNSSNAVSFTPNNGVVTAHNITKGGGNPLAIGDINGPLAEGKLRYNLANTRWELLNPASGAGDPYVALDTLLLNLNNSLVDTSPLNVTFTAHGSLGFQNSITPFAGTYALDTPGGGATKYIDATSGACAFGTGDYTVAMWIYPTATGQSSGSFWLNTGTTGHTFYIDQQPGAYTVGVGVSGVAPFLVSTNAMTQNAWNFVTVTRISGTVTVAIGGVSGGTASNSTNLSPTSISLSGDGGTNEACAGYLGPVRITKVIGRYTVYPFTPPTAPF